MKKVFFALCAVAVSAAFTSCGNKEAEASKKDVPAVPTEMTIAYVESDTIMNQYKFAKDIQAEMEKKQSNITATLSQKENALNAAYANLQKDYEAGKIASQQEFQSRQASIQQQANDYQALQQRLAAEFQEEQAKYSEALRDSLDHYIAVFNKDQKYSFIITKGGLTDNLLYANPACDITAQIVDGLNKNYKGMKKEAVAKEEKK